MNSPGKFRWVICALLFFSVAINYIDRLIIGILKGPLSEKLDWSDSDYGYIAAAFSFAYAFGYLIGGRTIDRLGIRRGLPLFVFCWSVAACAHGLCGLIGVQTQFRLDYPWFSWTEKGMIWMTLIMPMTAAGFILARIGLGLSEGGNFPAAIKTVAEWFPVRERALATGWFNAGSNVGAILCPIGVPLVFKYLGWEATFYITGTFGFFWLIAWWFVYESPERHQRLSPGELAYIKSGQPAVLEKKVEVPWLSLLRYRAVWAYIIASILAAPAWGFYQFFVPDFLTKRFHLELQAIGWWTGAFFAIAAAGGVAGGWLAEKLLDRGHSLDRARKISLLICALAVVPVFFAPFAGQIWLAVLIMGVAGAAHQGWSSNLYSVVSDTMPKEAIGSVIGLGGFVCYFTGGFVNGLTGLILQKTGTYVSVFGWFSGMYVVSLIAIHFLVPKIQPEERRA
jgi:ACS family hexuronate transporter-like MFS transporter